MTPRELNAAFEGVYGRAATPPRLADFAELMTRHPDQRIE
jgi:hypothetical protein